jgi:hypothetical protein
MKPSSNSEANAEVNAVMIYTYEEFKEVWPMPDEIIQGVLEDILEYEKEMAIRIINRDAEVAKRVEQMQREEYEAYLHIERLMEGLEE